MPLYFKGNFLAAARVSKGVLSRDNYSVGLSLAHGDVLETMGYTLVGPEPFAWTAAAIDATYFWRNIENRAEIQLGRRDGAGEFLFFWRTGLSLLDEGRLKIEAQPVLMRRAGDLGLFPRLRADLSRQCRPGRAGGWSSTTMPAATYGSSCSCISTRGCEEPQSPGTETEVRHEDQERRSSSRRRGSSWPRPPVPLHAAVGCDLNDPDRDVKRLFPGSTGFKTLYVSISKRGGDELLKKIEARLGDRFTGLFETADVPYTMYEIYKGAELIGYIHGVNQKGTYGGLQVFLALDTAGVIRGFYYQKLTSKAAKAFRSLAFGEQFRGLSLEEFYRYDVASGREIPPVPSAASPIPIPGPRRISGPPCGRSKRTSSSSTSSSSATPT